jgi:hypothetical protein
MDIFIILLVAWVSCALGMLAVSLCVIAGQEPPTKEE